MSSGQTLKLLFIVNPGAGAKNTDWGSVIQQYFSETDHTAYIFNLPYPCHAGMIRDKIYQHQPDRVIAVGGDGTLKLVVESASKLKVPVGLIPGGSANGMAKELGIATDPQKALDIVVNGEIKPIDCIRVNEELCIHLSDIGFNAFIVKTFEKLNSRGMWGYLKAAWKVFWKAYHMDITISADNKFIQRKAAMIVLANAQKYGTGAVINPEGDLSDGLFEIVVIKKLALSELFKMMVSHKPYNPEKAEVFKTTGVEMKSRHKAHFQVDGEYLGKVNTVKAAVIKHALEFVVPQTGNE